VALSLAQEAPAERGTAPAPAAAAAAPNKADSVSARLTRIEERLGDLQVLVGTLESFVRSKPGAVLPQEAAGGGAGGQAQGDLGPRVDALETQIGALTSQLEQISHQLSALKAQKELQAPASPPPSNPPTNRQGQAEPSPDEAVADAAGDAGDAGDTSKARWYGPKPGEDQVSAPPGSEAKPLSPHSEGGAAGGDSQSMMAALPEGDAQSLYERGYGALLQRDYAGAATAFRQLIEGYPKDPLAGNAQYWIGESFYRRGQYKNAADAFLKGYKKYKFGDKAPETLLKLGMSLAELGQKDAACSTFGELKSKYPSAPAEVRDEANAERKKARC
jgi:tol-pal system protein YbgF